MTLLRVPRQESLLNEICEETERPCNMALLRVPQEGIQFGESLKFLILVIVVVLL